MFELCSIICLLICNLKEILAVINEITDTRCGGLSVFGNGIKTLVTVGTYKHLCCPHNHHLNHIKKQLVNTQYLLAWNIKN